MNKITITLTAASGSTQRQEIEVDFDEVVIVEVSGFHSFGIDAVAGVIGDWGSPEQEWQRLAPLTPTRPVD